MAVKEYPKENRCEIVIPKCPCGRTCLRRQASYYLDGEKRRSQMLSTFDAGDLGGTDLTFICPKGHGLWQTSIPDACIINKYPPNNITFVDMDGNLVD